MERTMEKKIKVSCVFLVVMAFIFFSLHAAYPDAPGVRNPGKRVPANSGKTEVVQEQKKAVKSVKRLTKPRRTRPAAPAPKPVVAVVNPLNEAIWFIKQEKYRKALPYILCAVDSQTQNADVWYWFGVWSDKTGNFSNAQKYYTKALEIDPNYPALTRIVIYPRDPFCKNPLWDTIRPPATEAIYSNREMYVSEPPREVRTEAPVYVPPAP